MCSKHARLCVSVLNLNLRWFCSTKDPDFQDREVRGKDLKDRGKDHDISSLVVREDSPSYYNTVQRMCTWHGPPETYITNL